MLEWDFEWGDHLRFLEKKVEEGRSIPALNRRPQLFEDLKLEWKCFSELNRTRQCGFSHNPFQLTEIVCWMQLYRIEDKIRFLHLILSMDLKWLELVRLKNGNS